MILIIRQALEDLRAAEMGNAAWIPSTSRPRRNYGRRHAPRFERLLLSPSTPRALSTQDIAVTGRRIRSRIFFPRSSGRFAHDHFFGPIAPKSFKNQFVDVYGIGASGKMQHFHSDHVVVRVVIQHYAGSDLLGIQNLRVVKTQLKRVRFRINRQFHSFPFILRSKWIVTIFNGVARGSHTTRSTR